MGLKPSVTIKWIQKKRSHLHQPSQHLEYIQEIYNCHISIRFTLHHIRWRAQHYVQVEYVHVSSINTSLRLTFFRPVAPLQFNLAHYGAKPMMDYSQKVSLQLVGERHFSFNIFINLCIYLSKGCWSIWLKSMQVIN